METKEVDEQEIKERLDKLTEVWDKFQNIQCAIRETRKRAVRENEDESQQMERIEMEEEEEEAAFEDSYFKIVSSAKRRLGQFSQLIDSTTVTVKEAATMLKTSVKLPTITLPTFNGQYSQWMQFKDAFLSLIDNNPTLSEIQKLQYLRGTLKNEALQFIEGLETTAENYSTA